MNIMSIVHMMLVGGGILLILFTLTWALQLKTKNAGIVDTIWSISFPVLALTYFFLAEGFFIRKILILVLVTIWGLRLGLHLLSRTLGHDEDARYTALRDEWGEKQNLLMPRFFYFQAILALVLSIPFALIISNPETHLKTVEIIGSMLWLLSFVGESLADHQLKKFKQNSSNKGKVCDVGLWHYSRHPNYFFEWMIWLSYFIIAIGSPWGIISIACPLLMLFFLLRVTGIPYTERQSMKSKGKAYIEYQNSTSAFVPWRKKKQKTKS